MLVAEDDPSVRLTLEFVLEDGGFDVIMAEDGEKAYRLAQEEHPDAILLDQIMPKMDGKEVFSALRSDQSTIGIPVFVLTGMARESTADWVGAHFVGKPFSPDDLIRRIRRALGTS